MLNPFRRTSGYGSGVRRAGGAWHWGTVIGPYGIQSRSLVRARYAIGVYHTRVGIGRARGRSQVHGVHGPVFRTEG